MSQSLPTLPASPTALRPSRARFRVVFFIVTLAIVTYLDRACIATLAPSIQKDLQLDDSHMSRVFSSFALAYALFEIPTALWAFRTGTRRVLTRIVVWWSLLTFATAAVLTPNGIVHFAHSFWPGVAAHAWLLSFCLIVAVRFLFGMGEAGAWPCAAASYAHWIPAPERGFAKGLMFAGAHLSGGLTPLLVGLLLNTAHLHWRTIFLLFGSVGLVWAAAWYHWFRDDPADHPAVNPAELHAIHATRAPVPTLSTGWPYWRTILTHPNILALCLMYMGNSYMFYFCITWLPKYIKEHHHLADTPLAVATGLPLILSVVGDIFGGLTTDRLSSRFGSRIGRAGLGAACYALAALALLVTLLIQSPWVAIIALSLAVALVMFTLGAAWATVIDIGGHHTAMIAAVMNTAGNSAAIASPLVTIYVKDHWPGGWNAPIYVIFSLILLGTIAWCFINPRRHIFD